MNKIIIQKAFLEDIVISRWPTSYSTENFNLNSNLPGNIG